MIRGMTMSPSQPALLSLSLSLTLAYLSGGAGATPQSHPDVRALSLLPARIALRGPYTEARALVEGRSTAGETRDLSGVAKLKVTDPNVATVDSDGVVRPRRDGRTWLIASVRGRNARIPVEVTGMKFPAPPSFVADVIPILTRAGCNMGACHGAGSGKGGFKLSLFGYDPDWDYDAITRMSSARRITRCQPERSLLLRKPTMGVEHRGGVRFEVNSPEYRLLRAWIAGSMPGPDPKEPAVTRLEALPPVRTLGQGQTQRFLVYAHYSDGTRRDVTGQTVFTASDETVASVTPDGEARVTGPGEGAVVIRYRSLVATAGVISPFGNGIREARKGKKSLALSRARYMGIQAPEYPLASSRIDSLVDRKLHALGLSSSGRCSDSDFLRRATLDVTGLLPTPDEARTFLTDRSTDKRAHLIDALVASPEYIDYWTLQWADLLRVSRQVLPAKAAFAYNAWIRQAVAENRPWNRFARELLLAQGSAYSGGAANYYRTVGSPQEFAEATTQVFLGVRMQCARCHNHPYDRWTQNQYYQMAAFFARVSSKKGERPDEQVVYLSDSGEVQHLRTKKEVAPCALDARPIEKSYSGDRRAVLADWVTASTNPFFARSVVNRVWKHFLGRGLVEPVDDLRATNPPTNAPLLDFLAAEFVRSGYDLRHLMRSVLLSRVYQRTVESTRANVRDGRYGSHFLFKRLGSEQLLDAVSAATGVPEKFDGFPLGLHAMQIAEAGVPSYFMDQFGRPARSTACACERQETPNLGQMLVMMNDAAINTRLTAKNGRIQALIDGKKTDVQIVEDLYLAALARLPNHGERQRAMTLLHRAKERRQATEDLLWALLNSKEFLFNH